MVYDGDNEWLGVNLRDTEVGWSGGSLAFLLSASVKSQGGANKRRSRCASVTEICRKHDEANNYLMTQPFYSHASEYPLE